MTSFTSKPIALFGSLIISCFLFNANFVAAQTYQINSPSKEVSVRVSLTQEGTLQYRLQYKGKSVIQSSSLGMQLADGDLSRGFQVVAVDSTKVNETWQPVWGEVKEIKNQYHQLIVHLKQQDDKGRLLDLVFRVFDDGLGFRYSFPFQNNLKNFIVVNELTQFSLTGNHKAFWLPGDFDSNEYRPTTSLLSEVDAKKISDDNGEIAVRMVKDASSVQTPLMMKTTEGLYINLHEAALVNYPAMQLHIDKSNFKLSSSLVPDAFGNKAYLQSPFSTPWRTILVSDKATDILASKTILNLNEPTKIQNTSWIKPTKMIGVWWEMHLSKSTWDYAGTQSAANAAELEKMKPSGRHGATTANTKRYIDFAAQHGFDGVLVEGWNTGWEDWFGNWKEEVFDFVTPYPDYDVQELHRYAASKGVKIIMHHETSGSVTNYERRMDKAYAFMKQNGYDAVKTGYVGKIIPRGEYHDGQWMINHYNRVAERTADNEIMVDMHESVRPTGMQRTYPNWLACEAARGNEFNAWSKGNLPEHETILPFTRLMGGPMDYTPGIFQIKLDEYGKKDYFVHTTLAKQLALYVTMFSPLQMAADLPENYEKHLDAFQFIKDVALDWDDSKIVEAEPGDFITIARKAKGKSDWFIGSITDENKHVSIIPLNFLDPKQKYIATIYKDAPDAHWDKNPMAYAIDKWIVDNKTTLKIALAEGGGCAVRITPATAESLKGLKGYK
ncbi:MAG: glycoside hydrolase family 97 protein [Bacteroidetes bacterium]|nr:glycoside hydrolase family 97 protein [Bacteroidota bacterium]